MICISHGAHNNPQTKIDICKPPTKAKNEDLFQVALGRREGKERERLFRRQPVIRRKEEDIALQQPLFGSVFETEWIFAAAGWFCDRRHAAVDSES